MVLPVGEVAVPQPYGALFFAAAERFEEELSGIDEASRNPVVIIRLRRKTDLGTTFMEILARYAKKLAAAGSKLVLVSADARVIEQLQITGVTEIIGDDKVYPADTWVGSTVRRAHDDAVD